MTDARRRNAGPAGGSRLLPRLTLFTLAVALGASLSACSGGAEEAALRARADAFGDLMVELRDLPEATARRRVESFLEPGPDRDARVAAYVQQAQASTGMADVMGSAVHEVVVAGDGERAAVTFAVIARTADGQEIRAFQRTEWRLLDGRWYRTRREADKELAR